MTARGKPMTLRLSAAFLAAGLLTLAAPASAEGIFASIFGRLIQRPEVAVTAPTRINSYAPTSGHSSAPARGLTERISAAPRIERGPATAFCVRTCDGHFFPVRAHTGMSAAETCRAFCPASKTRLYSGSLIDRAVASDGSRYADLDAAFLYRRHLVAGCTCNGRDPLGLAQVDVKTDPTLRPGDAVATRHGMVAFTGMKNRVAEFTPVTSYPHFAKNHRDTLAEMRIMPPNPGAPKVAPVTLPLAEHALRDDSSRSARLER
jgi:Protein of unknown function (DUF2865)